MCRIAVRGIPGPDLDHVGYVASIFTVTVCSVVLMPLAAVMVKVSGATTANPVTRR